MRHGHYGSVHLNTKGITQILKNADQISEDYLSLNTSDKRRLIIYHSPLPRARQTAELLAGILGDKLPQKMILVESEKLDIDHEDLECLVSTHLDSHDEDFIAVTHEPVIKKYLDQRMKEGQYKRIEVNRSNKVNERCNQ